MTPGEASLLNSSFPFFSVFFLNLLRPLTKNALTITSLAFTSYQAAREEMLRECESERKRERASRLGGIQLERGIQARRFFNYCVIILTALISCIVDTHLNDRLSGEKSTFERYFGGLTRLEATIHTSDTGNTASKKTCVILGFDSSLEISSPFLSLSLSVVPLSVSRLRLLVCT